MKPKWLAGAVVIAGLACTASLGIVGHAVQQGSGVATLASEPWQVGRCYRVFPSERDQFYIFKVIGPPAGPWIRVQTDPAAPRVPGASPQAPLWLNASSTFAVQQWACSD